MAVVSPQGLAGAVAAVAAVLEAASVVVIGVQGRQCYPFESATAAVTVVVHLDCASGVDQVGELLGLDAGPDHLCGRGLYTRAGDWEPGVHVSAYGPALPVAVEMGVL